MLKVLLVTEKFLTGRTLQKTLGDSVRVDTVGVGKTSNLRDQDIILYDLDSDAPVYMADITHLRSLCGFEDKPLIVVVEPSRADVASRALQVGATGVLSRPFDIQTTRDSLVQSLKPVGVKGGADSRVLPPFVSSIVPMIQEAMGAKVIRKATFLKRSYTLFGEITGVVSLAQGGYGSAALSFQQDLAFRLSAGLEGRDEKDLVLEDVSSAIGWFVATVADRVVELNPDPGCALKFDVPSVVIGHGHSLDHFPGQPVITVIFEVDTMLFALQLCLSLKSQTSTVRESRVPTG